MVPNLESYEIVVGDYEVLASCFMEVWQLKPVRTLIFWVYYPGDDGSFEFEPQIENLSEEIEILFQQEARIRLRERMKSFWHRWPEHSRIAFGDKMT